MRSPEDKERFLRLFKYQVTEEELTNVVKTLRSPDCAIERLELVKINFTDKMASILALAFNIDCSLKEIIFEKCRLKFS